MALEGFAPMPPDLVHTVTLTCHPETPAEAVRGIAARVQRAPGGTLVVTFAVEGELDRVRVPAPRTPRVESGLWQHTCCEIFIARKGVAAYHEFDLSPSGEWAEYAFDGYRTPRAGESRARGPAPQVNVHSTASKLELDAVIQIDRLSAFHSTAVLSLALSAVIEDIGGALSYWALRHPPGKPDFHHPRAFALDLAAPASPRANGTPGPGALHRVGSAPAPGTPVEFPAQPPAGGEE
jgi:hypothetical protein